MAKNHIKFAEAVDLAISRGMPSGMSEDFMRKIPFLMKRIMELEKALIPFASTFQKNRDVNQELILVYKKDCLNAFAMLDTANAYDIPRQLPEYPAA